MDTNRLTTASKSRELTKNVIEDNRNLYENVQKFFEIQNQQKSDEQRTKTLGIKKSSKFGLFKRSTMKKEKNTKPHFKEIAFTKVASLLSLKSVDQTYQVAVASEVKKCVSFQGLSPLETLPENIEVKDSAVLSKSPNRLHSDSFIWISFNKLVLVPGGIESYYKFLKMEFSHENILFWCEVERYKNTEDVILRRKLGESIFETFIGAAAGSELNLSMSVAKEVERRIGLDTYDKALFREAQKEIEMLMETDSFRRYLLSNEYKAFREMSTIN